MAPAKRALSALGHVRIDAPELINVEADDSAPVAGHVESVPMDQADPALVGGSPGAVYARGSATWWAPQRSISRRRAPIQPDDSNRSADF